MQVRQRSLISFANCSLALPQRHYQFYSLGTDDKDTQDNIRNFRSSAINSWLVCIDRNFETTLRNRENALEKSVT
jgi:hypothetical protein